jgi:hypothetical protein
MLAGKVLMISPDDFGFNHDTALDNFFQKNFSLTEKEIKSRAQKEFQSFKTLLENGGIEVVSFSLSYPVPCPDAVFPNNWFSTHPSGEAVFYPMKSASRRNERHHDIIEYLKSHYKKIINLSENENQNKFLEGTGSIVIGHANKTAYASVSQRTDKSLFYEWCKITEHKPVLFHAKDENENPVYHTNVLLCIGNGFAMVCLESVKNKNERKLVADSLVENGKEIIEVSLSQMHHFAANALALQNKKGEQVLVISLQGWNALDSHQQKRIRSFCPQIITPELNIIETCGGGSARCMLAELF